MTKCKSGTPTGLKGNRVSPELNVMFLYLKKKNIVKLNTLQKLYSTVPNDRKQTNMFRSWPGSCKAEQNKREHNTHKEVTNCTYFIIMSCV